MPIPLVVQWLRNLAFCIAGGEILTDAADFLEKHYKSMRPSPDQMSLWQLMPPEPQR
jgi:hypothetical protein